MGKKAFFNDNRRAFNSLATTTYTADYHVYYKFEDDLLDSSGNAYHITETSNYSFVKGRLSTGVRLVGTGYLRIPDAAELKTTQTILAITKLETTVSNKCLYSKSNDGNSGGWGCSVVYAPPVHRVALNTVLSTTPGGSGAQYTLNAIPIRVTNRWHLIAAVLDFPNNILRIYYDGELVNSLAIPSTRDYLRGTGQIYIGANTQGGAGDTHGSPIYSLYNGIIDEFAIVNKALSQTEIQEIIK